MTTHSVRIAVLFAVISLSVLSVTFIGGCANSMPALPVVRTVPREAEWGIYELDLPTQDVRLLYGTPNEIYASTLRLNSAGDRLVFAQKVDGQSNDDLEIFSIGTDSRNLKRLTENNFWDLYPAWSPDGNHIAFLSKREKDLDIYLMDANGANVRKLYDSGSHDADIDWVGDSIVFTSQFAVWRVRADGTQPTRVTSLSGRGEWGIANLPKGDYDPRLSPDGSRIVFERLEDTSQPNGGYNIFVINTDGTDETRLTNNGYSQGIASWSRSGEKIVYVIAAIGGTGKYDLYMMNSDGTANHDITPDYFPADFLCHSPVFSKEESKVYFIGQWWE